MIPKVEIFRERITLQDECPLLKEQG